MITTDDIKDVLPAHLKTAASQSLADQVNNISKDPDTAKFIRENFVSYTSVLKEGRFKTEDYVNAVAYVSFKLMGYTNQEAYKRTFENRYLRLVARGASAKDISAYVSAYNKNILVNKILEQTLIPTWILNQDIYQTAINTQAEIMSDPDVSFKVRSDAADSLLNHLKKPESKKVELNIGVETHSGMNELRDMISGMAVRQQELIGQGVTTREIAHQKLGKGLKTVNSSDTVDVEDAVVLESTPYHTTPAQGSK
jgi:hypothetical protein